MMKIYLASSLSQTSGDLKQVIVELKEKLKTVCELQEYFGLGPGEAKDVYLHDIKCIDNSDLIVAEVSQASLGVGYEIGYALSRNKPVMAFALEGVLTSRMIEGITDSNFSLRRYKYVDEIISAINKLS